MALCQKKIAKLGNAEFYLVHGGGKTYGLSASRANQFIDQLVDAENQLMKGAVEERAEIELTYNINTIEGEQKVRELFYNNPHDKEQEELFERVFKMAQQLNVEVRHALRDKGGDVNQSTKYFAGWYMLDRNSARVKHNGNIKIDRKGEVLLHELVHSVTSRAIFLKEQGHMDLLNPAQIKAIEEMQEIFSKVQENAKSLGFTKWVGMENNSGSGDYGLKNVHEFVAELANPAFREKLKQVAMFDDTVKAVTCVATGVEKTETAYDRLTKALYQLMDNYDADFGEKFQSARYANIRMNSEDTFMNEKERLMSALDSLDASVRRGAASSELADDEVLRKAFNDQHWQVREDAMRNPNASEAFLHECYENADPYDKAIILENRQTGVETLKSALDDDDELRILAVNHSNADEEVLSMALEDNIVPDVAETAKQRLEDEYDWNDERFKEYYASLKENPIVQSEVDAQQEVAAQQGGFSLPENIQNTEFGRQAEKIFQSTAENSRKIENTADEHSKEVLSKHHTYIEALKADFQYWVDMGDYAKADERLGDIRINQQMFDERIRKELGIKFDMMGQPEPTEQPQGNLTISHGADNRQAEMLKSYDWYQEQIKQADEKIKDAQFELAKQPENAARQEALEKAITQKTALELECRYGVASPKLVDLYRKQQEFPLSSNIDDIKKSVELNEAFQSELKQMKQNLPKDFLSPSDKELLKIAKESFNKPSTNKVDIEVKLDFLQNPKLVQDLGLSEKQIQNALTEALQNGDKALRMAAINSPQMKPEWLQKVIEKHPDQKTVQYAQKVLNKEPLEKSSGFSSSVVPKQQVKQAKRSSMDI